MALVLDIETDSLDAKKIWVVITKDTKTNEICIFREPTGFADHVRGYNTIIGHNLLSFDVPVLNRLWNAHIKLSQLVDTMILSQLFNPNREGGHSLRNLAQLAGCNKLDFSDFSEYTEDMLKYCTHDVEITHSVYNYLMSYDRYGFSQQSISLEHNIRHVINKQQEHGFLIDIKKAIELLYEIKTKNESIEKEIRSFFKPKVRAIKNIKVKHKKDGSISKIGLKHIEDMKDLGGDHTTIRYEDFNLASPKQIVERMEEYGWNPIQFTPKGSPKVCEENLNTLPASAPESVKKLALWKSLETRWKTVESWVDASSDDGRVHGRVFTMGAVTGRMTHSDPNMANIVSSNKLYGKESRECFIAPEGYMLVDVDASGLELRMLAHYMNDEDFTNEVVNGDPHTANMKAAGLSTRAEAKTFIYAFLYGAGAEKIGSIVGGTSKTGSQLKKTFLSNMPSLKKLQETVSKKAYSQGYVNGIDGRRIRIRSPHAGLNTLLQGAGSIVCKQWAIEIDKVVRRERLDAHLVCSVHDQYVYEVSEKCVDRFKEVCLNGVEQSGKHLKVRCPLSCDIGVGKTWYEAEH
tara:strand:- start:4631 stop:6358 length:1728 start_codon:yes stop_codon:yes gene_type:complete